MSEMHIFPRRTKNMKHKDLQDFAKRLKDTEEAIPKVLAYCKKARTLVKELDSTTPKDKNKRAKTIKKLYNIMIPAVQPSENLCDLIYLSIPRNAIDEHSTLNRVDEYFRDLLNDESQF